MTKMSDLSEDLAREILSRVRLTSQSSVRSTCKKWNALSKLAAWNQFLGFMMMDSKVCSLTFDFQRNRNDEKAFNDPVINQVSVLDHIKISKTFYCDGLLLLATKDSRLLVWNPYLKQIRRIRPRNSYSRLDRYAFGYENKNNNRNHKILRFIDDHFFTDQVMKPLTGFQFDFKSGSFFIHEEKKLAVVFDLDGYKRTETRRYQTAHIIGEDGYRRSY